MNFQYARARPGNRFSFSAGRTATRRAGNKFAVNVRGALGSAADGTPLRSRGDVSGESGAVVVRFRHSIYRKDGDIMQPMGMPGYTHARAHKEPLLEETSAGDGGREARDRMEEDLCTLGSMHVPSAACATWAASNSRPVLLRIRY